VIACLLKGKYGLTSAASVAKDMLRSFPSVRFGLMVGIAGGAPSKKHDIRLRDVVMSLPIDRTSEVIYYEFSKTI
jgi:nucleoside phosphorylase